MSAATVGAVLASRRPRHPVGWLLLGLGLALNAQALVDGVRALRAAGSAGALPGARYLAGFYTGAVLLWLACAGFVLLLTPTGSLPSPRWRWWARIAAAAAVVWLLASVVQPDAVGAGLPGLGEPAGRPGPAPRVLASLAGRRVVVLGSLVVGAGSLVVRFRRARGVERQQLRWLAWAAALAAVALLVAGGRPWLTGQRALVDLALGVCAPCCRWRPARRSCAIGCTTWTGSSAARWPTGCSPCCWAAATPRSSWCSAGCSAGLQPGRGRGDPGGGGAFQPARRRIQAAVDRRFNRRRYDAARTIAAFSARLRQQVDLDTLTAELLAVVDQTMQPTSASLWLRPSDTARLEAAHQGRIRCGWAADGGRLDITSTVMPDWQRGLVNHHLKLVSVVSRAASRHVRPG